MIGVIDSEMNDPGKLTVIYENKEGNRFYQLLCDLVETGTLIDPYTGDDMEIVGWTIDD